MPTLFPEWTNNAFRFLLAAGVATLLSILIGLMLYVRTPYNTEQHQPIDQPVEFDHRHHARDDGIACLYCHTEAERSPEAGIPSAETCMGCHNQIWNDSPLLEPVRRSYFSGIPIAWRRVHALADFAYFDHSVHVRGGVDCVHCHGRVDQMARVYRVSPLQMEWCLECHRDPYGTVAAGPDPEQPRSMVGAMEQNLEPSLPDSREINRLTTCSACHR